MFPKWNKRNKTMNNTNTKVKPRFNYTQNAWEGEKYRKNEGLYGASLAKAIRLELKEKLPNCKFSVTKQTYSGGQSINVALMSANFNPFNELTDEIREKIKDNCRRSWGASWENQVEQSIENYKRTTTEKKYEQINQYYISDSFYLTEEAKVVFKKVMSVLNSYNFNDSDSQIDYFHTNFYSNISIGKWDKPFQLIN